MPAEEAARRRPAEVPKRRRRCSRASASLRRAWPRPLDGEAVADQREHRARQHGGGQRQHASQTRARVPSRPPACPWSCLKRGVGPGHGQSGQAREHRQQSGRSLVPTQPRRRSRPPRPIPASTTASMRLTASVVTSTYIDRKRNHDHFEREKQHARKAVAASSGHVAAKQSAGRLAEARRLITRKNLCHEMQMTRRTALIPSVAGSAMRTVPAGPSRRCQPHTR